MKYKVTNINYDIEYTDVFGKAFKYFGISDVEDIEVVLEDIPAIEFDDKCIEIAKSIKESLPVEMIVEIDDETDGEDEDEKICNIISDKTGWLVLGFEYEEMEEE